MPGARSLEIEVNPEVLNWTIKNSGFSTEQISNRLRINPDLLDEWLKGARNPELKKLERLSQVLKRPLAVFFLPNPPKEKPLPKDYRMIPDRVGKFDTKTLLAIRRARRLQRITKELSRNLNSQMESNVFSTTLSENPKAAAKKFVELFNINNDVRKKWKTPYDAFNFFRNLIEDKNILVFKMSMPLEDVRGFTLDGSPAVVVVNSKDLPEAQVFSSLHELGHVILNKPGLSIPDNALFQKNVDSVEKWCNEFASEILLPKEYAKEYFEENKEKLVETKTLNLLSRKLNISKAMLLYNMYKLNYINYHRYNEVLGRYNPLKPVSKKEKKKSSGGVSPDKRCLSERGQIFVSLVSKNIDKGLITRSDAIDYLSIKSKNLEKVMSKAEK